MSDLPFDLSPSPFWLRPCVYVLCICLEIDPKAVEAWVDKILGPKTSNEYDLLLSKLGGTRVNRVFHAFAIEALQCIAEAKIIAQRQRKEPGMVS